eukprot:TRINITY_DN68170_c0_g1_i1.p1 TRINITY_DN68170_c0_g1~~TRINITY_DN68170_c0_g1_i1.p1  ORF type:complete len:576 (+),score=80.23 TRINITY_DN68170_c0_g1_i1:49-1728(+)
MASAQPHALPESGGAERLVIRVLDPAVVSHGMNFFWRRAHLLPSPPPSAPPSPPLPPLTLDSDFVFESGAEEAKGTGSTSGERRASGEDKGGGNDGRVSAGGVKGGKVNVLQKASLAAAIATPAPTAPLRRTLIAVHANGVEPKDYFLRDRGLWFIDDFEERFGKRPRFLTYVHPRGLGLAHDFETLAAAVDVAIMLRRRVVLPRTMNCRNCPAYKPYGMDAWPLEHDEEGEQVLAGCTFDYFSRAGLVTGDWLNYTAESHVTKLKAFRALRPRATVRSIVRLRKAVDEARGRALSDILSAVAVVELRIDVRAVRDFLKAAVGGSALDTLPCSFRPWPANTYACRDAFLVQQAVADSGATSNSFTRTMRLSHRGPSLCDGHAQAGCGVVPFTCCEVFFGWSDKLEALGRGAPPWDLPCGCGLESHCLRVDGDRSGGGGEGFSATFAVGAGLNSGQACCMPRAPVAAHRFAPGCGVAPAVLATLPRLVSDDFDTYSSSILREHVKGRIRRVDVEKLCMAGMLLHRGEAGESARRRCAEVLDVYVGAQRAFVSPHPLWLPP